MAKKFAITTTDPLTLGTDFSMLRLADNATLENEVIYDPDGVFMQSTGKNITHNITVDYYIEDSTATLPVPGLVVGSYQVISVNRNEENRTHNTISVNMIAYEENTGTPFTTLL